MNSAVNHDDEQRVNRRFCSAIHLHRTPFFWASRITIKRCVCDVLIGQGRRVSWTNNSVCTQSCLTSPRHPDVRPDRTHPLVVCSCFGFNRFAYDVAWFCFRRDVQASCLRFFGPYREALSPLPCVPRTDVTVVRPVC